MVTRAEEEEAARKAWIEDALFKLRSKPLSDEDIQAIREALPPVTGTERPKSEPISYTYFMRNSSGNIKIGKSDKPEERRKGLSTAAGEEIELLGYVIGGYRLEANLHRRFSHLRLVGEWFEPGTDLLAYIKEVLKW